MKRDTKYYLIGTVALAGLAMVVWMLLRQDSLQQVAKRAHRAIQLEDGHAFYNAMSEFERDSYDLSEEQWTRFLRDVVTPAAKGWTIIGEPEEEWSRNAEELGLLWLYAKPTGEQVRLRINAARSAEGPRAIGLVRTLFVWLPSVSYPTGKGRQTKLDIFRSAAIFFSKEAARLESYGLHGLYNVQEQRLESWEELRGRFERFVDRVDATRKAASQQPPRLPD